MKFLHTADLHIGKRIYEVSMLEDQKHILKQILRIAMEEEVAAVVIAGDVYDRPIPPTDGVEILDWFLTELVSRGIKVILISGNHDSPERLSFGDRILERQGLYIAGSYEEPLKSITLQEGEREYHFVCMPFVKPAVTDSRTSAEAVEKMLSKRVLQTGEGHSNILVTHYFVTGEDGEEPERSESETEVSVGGLDGVPSSLFASFDYVALGHLHKPQRIRGGNIHYAGSPLKYSFSERNGDKSVHVVEIEETGTVNVKKRVLEPLHEMRCIRGELAKLMQKEVIYADGISREDYIQAILTDKVELIDPMSTLRSVYPNVLQILPEKNQDLWEEGYESRLTGERKSTEELFLDFYEMLQGEPMDEIRRELVLEVIKEEKLY